MAAIGAIPSDALEGYVALGELGLDGRLAPHGRACCQRPSRPSRATWASSAPSLRGRRRRGPATISRSSRPHTLLALVNHLGGYQLCSRPTTRRQPDPAMLPDLADVRGQEVARRALEVAAAGGHNLLMVGPPGAGKSMLAARLPSILPPLNPRELLDVSMIQSIAGELAGGALSDRRPFRSPHHSASMAALVGGGLRVRPGEAEPRP